MLRLRFRDFSLRTKFNIAFIILGVSIIIIALFVLFIYISLGLNRVEDSHLADGLQSMYALINLEQDTLLSNVKDYASWDDMYDYVNTRDEKWAKTNVTDWIPKNFNIDLILILDAKGNLIYQYGDFDEFQLGQDLSKYPLIRRAVTFKETKGFYSTSKGLALVASFQIVHTDESGPRNGTYLYARIMNKNMLEEFKTITRIDLSIISGKKILSSTVDKELERPKNFEGIYHKLSDKHSNPFIIYKPNFKVAFIYNILKDIERQNIGLLELISPRQVALLLRLRFLAISVWILLFVILSVFITVSRITNTLLRPLVVLTKTIDRIRRTGDLLSRVQVEAEDEVGILSNNFNMMLATLNKSQQELIEAQQNIMKVEKMAVVGELALGTVHQINNPLSIVMNRVQMLRRIISYKTPIPEADLEKDLGIIEAQARRAVDITNGLLTYTRPTSLRFEKCNINEVIKDIISLLKVSLEAEKVNVAQSLKTDLPLVQYCDYQRMRGVFMNIITNAQEAMPGGGKLEISTDYDAKEDMVCIKFTDNGCGIPEENLKKLFVPFFSTKADKTGLGLAISYNIVKGHKGRIEVESQIGRGATFTIKLPVLGGGLNI